MPTKRKPQQKQTKTSKYQNQLQMKQRKFNLLPNRKWKKHKNKITQLLFLQMNKKLTYKEYIRLEKFETTAAQMCTKPESTIIIKRRDNFAPQEVPFINKVSQTIVIDQVCTREDEQLFTLNQVEKPQNQSRKLNNPMIISVKAKKLSYNKDQESMDMEDSNWDDFNKNITHTKHFLLGVPKSTTGNQESSLTTERHSTKATKKQIDMEIQEPELKVKLTKPMQTKLKNIELCFNSLLEGAIPDEVSCRDQEKEIITKFIEEGIKNNGQSQALYISGVPGIGKTATVMEVKNKLQAKKKNFSFIYANAMNFGLPDNIYTFLLEQITGIEKVNKPQACLILTELFSKGSLPSTFRSYDKKIKKENKVLLLDECDNLFTPDQQVLYNLVDWPQQKHANLTVIMIANTMDFPERLKPKLQSRLGNHRVVFRPYTSAQIETILEQRLKDKKIKELFAPNTLNYLGKKIATISTDIRKTLSVCRTSIEIAKEELIRTGQLKNIEVNHVKMAYEKIYDKAYHSCLLKFNREQKILLIAIAVEIHSKGYNVAYLQQVLQRFNQFSIQSKEEPLTYNELKSALLNLSEINLVEIKEQNILLNKANWQQKLHESLEKDKLKNINDIAINLKINVDDIKNGLSNDTIFHQFSQYF